MERAWERSSWESAVGMFMVSLHIMYILHIVASLRSIFLKSAKDNKWVLNRSTL